MSLAFANDTTTPGTPMRIRVRLNRNPGPDPAWNPCDGAEMPMAADPEAFELNSRMPGMMSLSGLDGSTTDPAPSSVPAAAPRSRVGVWVVGMGLIGTFLAGATAWLPWPSTAPESREDSPSSIAATGRATAAQPLASAPAAGEAVGSLISEAPARPDLDQAVAPPVATPPVPPVLPPPNVLYLGRPAIRRLQRAASLRHGERTPPGFAGG